MNSTAKFPVTVTTPAIGSGSLLTIKGFGSFDDSHIKDAVAQRYIAPRNAGLAITAPDAAALGITAGEVNVPVVVHIRVNTTRHSSEWAIDFIKRGRPFIFELLINGGETATQVATKLDAAFTEYALKFNLADNGLPWTTVQATDTLTLTLKDPYLSFQSLVEFLPKGLTYGVKAVTTRYVALTTIGTGSSGTTVDVASTAGILVGDTIAVAAGTAVVVDIVDATTLTTAAAIVTVTAEDVTLLSTAQEPTFDGKYLEENVRMSLPSTSDSYGISPDELPHIAGGYTMITFTAIDDSTGGVSHNWKRHGQLGATRGEIGGTREFKFTLYFLEGTDMFDTDAKVDVVLQFLLDNATTTPTMLKGDLAPAADVAEFIA